MRVGISAELVGKMAGGMETYSYNLVKALSALDNVNHYNIYTSDKQALQNLDRSCPNFSTRYLGTPSRGLAVAFTLPLELFRRPVDIFHATFVPPVLSSAKYVFTVHDLAYLIHPEWFPPLVRYRLSRFISRGIRKAVKIITVSEVAKSDIVKYYDVNENNIEVIYEGVNGHYGPVKDKVAVRRVLKKYKIDGDYVLYTGRFHVRKNIIRLLRAFDIVRKEDHPELKMVLIGGDQYHGFQVFQAIKDMGLEHHVICPGHVEDRELPLFYNGARLFIYPSLFEGFGLPPLEAMRCGIPVIASNCTSLPEILGDAALLIDPYKIDDIAEKMIQLISNEDLRKKMIERGLLRASRFTWEETARKTLNVYKEACSQ